MIRTRLTGILMILACCVAGIACVTYAPQPVYTQPPVTSAAPEVQSSGAEDEPFYEDLSPYGQWVYVSGPGWVWSPYDTPASWRPYQVGHWVYTDYGWTWASDESFGWAVYHYGRWSNDPSYGWVWIPGTEWGPAWVAWHEGGGWVGWAPLPYQATWRAGVGLDWGGLSVNVALGPSYWHFVQARDMVDPGMRYRIAPPSRNVTLIQNTQNVTNYIFVNNHVVDHGVRVEKIDRAVGHPVPHYRVRETDSPDADRRGKVNGGEFVVFKGKGEHRGRSWSQSAPGGQDDPHPTAHPPRDDAPSQEGQQEGQKDSTGRGGQRGATTEPADDQHPHHPAWYPNVHRRGPGEDPSRTNPPTQSPRDKPAPSNPADAPAAPDDQGSNGASTDHPRHPETSAPSPGQGARGTQPGKPEQADAPIAQPATGNGQHGKPVPSKAPAGKAKGKNSGKAKAPAKDNKEADSDKSKSDKPDPDKQN